MAMRANPKLIGAFVVGGIALLVLIVVGFASTTFLTTKIPIVMHFPGEVGGLDVGSPVTFKGVRIGTVTGVELRFHVVERSFQIPVYAELETDRLTVSGGETVKVPGENIPALVKMGLRARLASESLVTGKLLVDLDFHPNTEARLSGGDTEGTMLEIPTIPTQLEELEASVSAIVKSLGSANLPGLVTDLRGLIDSLDTQVKAADPASLLNRMDAFVQSAQQDIDDVAASLKRTSDTLNERIGELSDSLIETSDEGTVALKEATDMLKSLQEVVATVRPTVVALEDAAQRADALIASAQGTIQPGSPVYRELVSALKEISGASRSLRALADNINRNPNSILFGRSSGGQ